MISAIGLWIMGGRYALPVQNLIVKSAALRESVRKQVWCEDEEFLSVASALAAAQVYGLVTGM